MAENHVPLLFRRLKITLCILHRNSGMGEPMKMISGFSCMRMPVIQKQIMQKSCPGDRAVIPAIFAAKPVAQIRNPDAVLPAGRPAMLVIPVHGQKHRMLHNVPDARHIRLVRLPCLPLHPSLITGPLLNRFPLLRFQSCPLHETRPP